MASVEKKVRNGRTTYQARWRDDQDQQRKKSFAKKGDADRFAATVEADKARGTYIELSKITVAEYARKWAESRPHRPTTARRTEMMVRLHIAGTRLGGRRLADVRPSEVQAWATDRGKVLAPTTLRQTVGLLRSVYAAAVLDRLVASSPVVRIQLPRHEKERTIFTRRTGSPLGHVLRVQLARPSGNEGRAPRGDHEPRPAAPLRQRAAGRR